MPPFLDSTSAGYATLTDLIPRLALIVTLAGLAGCSTTTGSVSSTASYGLKPQSLTVCSGYGCKIKEKFSISTREQKRLARIMRPAKASAKAERRAVKRAIAFLEKVAQRNLRFARDVKKSYIKHSGKRGQMDCIDESLNTTGYLYFMRSAGLLTHHKPTRNYAERGWIVTGHPHKAAVMTDKSGQHWVVDSWFRDNGGVPDIMPYRAWKKRSGTSQSS